MSDAPLKEPLPNPNSSIQPDMSEMLDPAAARLAEMQAIQFHGYDALTRVLAGTGSTLEADDLATLEAAQALLEGGGTQDALRAGTDDYEVGLAHMVPTLGPDDLAALTSALNDLTYLTTHLRTGDALPALPEGDTDAGGGLAPVNVDVPQVTQSGDMLNCTMGNWTGEPTSYAYQWQLDGNQVGTSDPDYSVQGGDAGKTAVCVVTATNAAGSTTAPPSQGVMIN
jgi:hypothetical protein